MLTHKVNKGNLSHGAMLGAIERGVNRGRNMPRRGPLLTRTVGGAARPRRRGDRV